MPETQNKPEATSNGTTPQPGAVIAPGAAASPSVEAPVETSIEAPSSPPTAVATPAPTQKLTPIEPAKPSNPPTQPLQATTSTAEPQAAAAPQDTETTPLASEAVDSDDGESLTWTASEFVAHTKTPGWYAALAGAIFVIAAVVFLATRDLVSVAVVVVAGIILGVYANHKPRQLQYRLDGRGIGVGDKYYDYEEFRSFAVVPEGAFSSIVFFPLKRFALLTTVYYAPDDEQKIVAILSDRLPFEEHRHDAIDSLMRRIRF